MNFLGGSQSYRFFKIVSINHNKYHHDDSRYKTKGSPANAAKKAFSQLSKTKNIICSLFKSNIIITVIFSYFIVI